MNLAAHAGSGDRLVQLGGELRRLAGVLAVILGLVVLLLSL